MSLILYRKTIEGLFFGTYTLMSRLLWALEQLKEFDSEAELLARYPDAIRRYEKALLDELFLPAVIWRLEEMQGEFRSIFGVAAKGIRKAARYNPAKRRYRKA